VARLRFFASAREAAGTAQVEIAGPTVGAVIDGAVARFGPELADLLPVCRLWLNGEETAREVEVGDHDEIAVLPPVSGGCVSGP
jgi:molybdopterin converting factor small subunit